MYWKKINGNKNYSSDIEMFSFLMIFKKKKKNQPSWSAKIRNPFREYMQI